MNDSGIAATATDLDEGWLDVGDGHRLYWRAEGDTASPVVCVLHGGPGGSMNPRNVTLFDTTKWRVVLFDQRGCGRSTPTADTLHNTTAHLVRDMETLRRALGIERWALFGGSWGTRLAMSYGIAHPDRCLGFLMRGVFLARREDISWFLWDVRRMFPDAHAAFCDTVEKLTGHAPRDLDHMLEITAPILHGDHPGRFELARAWDRFEIGMSSVGPMSSAGPPVQPSNGGSSASASASAPPAARPDDPRSITLAVLEHHYMLNVLPHEAPVLPVIPSIAHLPCEIVHGRYDMVCPFDQAWLLGQAWPAARLSIAEVSGHWGFSPEVAGLLKLGASRLRTRIDPTA